MAILQAKLVPEGVLTTAQGSGASQNSIEVGREYGMLEIDVLGTGVTAGTVVLQHRGTQVMGAAGPVRIGDAGGWVNVTDGNIPAAGMALSATALSGTFRVRYPRGEYQLLASGVTGGTITAAYSCTAEQR